MKRVKSSHNCFLSIKRIKSTHNQRRFYRGASPATRPPPLFLGQCLQSKLTYASNLVERKTLSHIKLVNLVKLHSKYCRNIRPGGPHAPHGPHSPGGPPGPGGPPSPGGLHDPGGPYGLGGPHGPCGPVVLMGPVSLVGPVSLMSPVGLVGPVGPVSLVGPVGLVGLVAPMGPVSLVGSVGLGSGAHVSGVPRGSGGPKRQKREGCIFWACTCDCAVCIHLTILFLLAPTGALVVMMVYYISVQRPLFRFSLCPLVQLMLHVSL